jgi:hypothetical protein
MILTNSYILFASFFCPRMWILDDGFSLKTLIYLFTLFSMLIINIVLSNG